MQVAELQRPIAACPGASAHHLCFIPPRAAMRNCCQNSLRKLGNPHQAIAAVALTTTAVGNSQRLTSLQELSPGQVPQKKLQELHLPSNGSSGGRQIPTTRSREARVCFCKFRAVLAQTLFENCRAYRTAQHSQLHSRVVRIEGTPQGRPVQ